MRRGAQDRERARDPGPRQPWAHLHAARALPDRRVARLGLPLVFGTGTGGSGRCPRRIPQMVTSQRGSGWSPDGNALRGRITLVAGATRGAGRGIAAALGEAGATVICTGRSSVNGPGGSDYDRPETIEETAELVTSLGGTGIAIGVDHLDPEQVRQLRGRGRDEHGRLDVLVNDIWGAEQLKG